MIVLISNLAPVVSYTTHGMILMRVKNVTEGRISGRTVEWSFLLQAGESGCRAIYAQQSSRELVEGGLTYVEVGHLD